jgi:cysteine desulfurase
MKNLQKMISKVAEVPSRISRWLGIGAKLPIYMDFQATTPLDPRVLKSMLPYLKEKFGNPHSRTHSFGWEAERGVEAARKQIAELIGADAKDIIITSGATESNNLAIKGVGRFYKKTTPGKPHIITTQIEHKCVIDTCRDMQAEGFDVTYLPVDKEGVVDPEEVRKAITKNTVLASIMAVNNEIGSIQPIREIGRLCRENGVFFHTDAAQAVGKIPINVDEMNIDLLSISGHKIYGPKGVGALYVRRSPRVRIAPLFSGGGQERGLRSGTLAPALIVGLGRACEIAREEMGSDYRNISSLSRRLVEGIRKSIPGVIRNGEKHAYPGCVNLSFPYIEGESLLMALPEVSLSSGSACTSASLEPSYVLKAIDVEEDLAHSSIRFGIGRFTKKKEIDYVIKKVVKSVGRLLELSPLFEMAKEGIDLSTIKWDDH